MSYHRSPLLLRLSRLRHISNMGPRLPSSVGTVLPAVPSNTVLPVITAADWYPGVTATCSTGTWTNSPTGYTYQWYADGAILAGSNVSTYVIQVNDTTKQLTCRVTASNAAGSNVAESLSQRVLWTPLVWGATMFHYLDTIDPAGLTEALGTITQFNDLSGSGHPQVQATQAAQPVKRSSAFFSNKNVAYFNGVQTTGPFTSAGSEPSNTNNPTDFSFLVFKQNMATGISSSRVFSHAPPATGETSGNGIVVATQAGTGNSIRATFGGVNGPTFTYDGSTAVMHCTQQLSTGAQMSNNGNAFVSETTPTARNIITGRSGISVNITTSTYGTIRSEIEFAIGIRIRSFVPTQSDVDKLFGWAAFKCGLQSLLPVGHTYKTSPP